MSKVFLTPITLVSLDSDPQDANEGDMYFNSSIGHIRVYGNGVWNTSGSGSSQADASFIVYWPW